MDIGKAFSYVFDDPEWIKKILIGGIVGIIPIVNFALFGYFIQIARNVAVGSERPLPEWGNFGEFFVTGFKFAVISLVYVIPGILFYCIAGSILGIGGASAAESDAAGAALGIGALCIMGIYMLLLLVGSFFSMTALMKFTETNDFGSALAFGNIISYTRANLGQVLMLWLMYIVASIVGSLGSVICIGILFTLPYGYYMFGHVLGQNLRANNNSVPTANYTQF
jgi:hypothetical protein